MKRETGVILTLVCLLVISMATVTYRDWQISEWYANELERKNTYEERIRELEEANWTAHREIERLNNIIVELDRGGLWADLSLQIGNDTHVVEGVVINFGVETAENVGVIMKFYKNTESGSVVFHTEHMQLRDYILGRSYAKIYQTFQFEIEDTFSFWHYSVYWTYNGVSHGASW
jgi:hypothetical protein